MGFGLVIIGYLTVLGIMPNSFVYYTWGIYIAVIGGLLMLAGFCRLAEYNAYFAAGKYVSVAYIFVLLGISAFVIPSHSPEMMSMFNVVSKIARICLLFVFHFYLFSGVSALAKEIGNAKIERKAKRNIVLTYIFFSSFVFELFGVPLEVSAGLAVFGLVYCIIALSLLYSCYMRITYEGHDEAIEERVRVKRKK